MDIAFKTGHKWENKHYIYNCYGNTHIGYIVKLHHAGELIS